MSRLLAFALIAGLGLVKAETRPLFDHAVGMYVHQHWPYKHPYAARTWTLEDWRGYADGLKKLGYNTTMIWPLLEIMPDPPTPSDRASLEKHGQVISMLHKEFGMHVMVVLCPNVVANNVEAQKATYETRHFFYVDKRVNPADRNGVANMIARREKLLQYLKEADAFAIIDSDPGSYPGSTNAEFVQLLSEHRKLFDRLRPGIELTYWMHAGWESYSRFYLGGLLFGDPQRFLTDLRLQLEMRAAYYDFLNATNEAGPMKQALTAFVSAADAWQSRIGYQDSWSWAGMESALRKLKSPAIDAVLKMNICIFSCGEGAQPKGYEDVRKYLADQETFTPRLLAAMKQTLASLH